MTEKSDWLAVFAAFFIGVAGAVQVGRVAPVATFIQQDLNLDLSAIGWLVSLITLASSTFGVVVGYWVLRVGLRKSLVAGAFAMATCAALAALVPTMPMLVGARIVEGLGYLVVVVAAPTLIAREAAQKDVPFALSLWGTFFTLGLSIAAFAGGAMVEPIGWRGWFFASAVSVVITSLIALISIPQDLKQITEPANVWQTLTEMPKASWLLGAAFLGLTLLALSILSLLPTYLVQVHGFAPGTAGSLTGSIALASIVGSLCYGMFANHLPEKIIAASVAVVLILSAFLAFADTAVPFQVVTFAAIAIFMSGILVAQTFAAVPRVARTPLQIGPTNGLVAQLGSVGALTGPPIIGALITSASWSIVPFVAAVFTLSFVGFFILALRSTNTSVAKEIL